MNEFELSIDSVGVRGDGVARLDGAPVFVPFGAPGDRLRVNLAAGKGEARAEIVEILEPGQRAQPVCRHFGECGGCSLQHLSPEAYAAAKLSWLAGALRQQGFKGAPVAPLHRLAPGTRRRARFALAREKGGALAGFHARRSRRIVDMRECAVLHKDLFALVAPLRDLAAALLPPGGEGHASLTLADAGAALLLDLPAAPGLDALETLAAFAAKHDLARLSWREKDGRADETIAPLAQRRPARVTLSGVAVDLPEDAFLQASEEADIALAGAVREAVGTPRRVADLYAGLGTFSFALAKNSVVHAVEGDEASVKALRAAALRAGLANVTAERRDLARRPLTPEDLSGFDAAVFDPPYAGAAEQSRDLAASQVPVIVAVSCNPASFARDARILADGGYALESVQAFDSFIWSANLEIVARFARR